ncbi:M4 family metallopeptidase [Calothrix sp. NIES-2098]|uniref:M4 family metallopeptidase n=1 Tax=Calothrix sp. NIES-2098 TaxID=1954171 RepID=UPI000B5F4376|nr:putative peptidase M4, thermolysin [Calothrix sp. NIES-2098]
MHTFHHHCCHNPLHCFVPPHVLDRLVESDDPEIRNLAIDAIKHSVASRTKRNTFAKVAMLAATPSPAGTKHRLVYDVNHWRWERMLPGKLVRSEGDSPVIDDAVNEAYDYSGITYDFYQEVFNRNSLDDKGMTLISSVHFGRNYDNAFWNGQQMIYGDGDEIVFTRFSKALDVVAHELTHGVVQFTSNLEYWDESGALNEHFADAMSALVKQWYLKQDVTEADWLMGDAIVGPKVQAKSIRTFKAEKAYEKDAILGTDPQPKHIKDKYTGDNDSRGVHINSGIPNHAFYLTAIELGGYSWEKVGPIWYQTLKNLNQNSNFQEAASMTYQVAGAMFGSDSLEQQAVKKAWDAVGISV